MVRKNAHLSSDHLVDYVDRMSNIKQVAANGEIRGSVATFGLRAVN